MSNIEWIKHINHHLEKTYGVVISTSALDPDDYMIYCEKWEYLRYLYGIKSSEPLDDVEVRNRLYEKINKYLNEINTYR